MSAPFFVECSVSEVTYLRGEVVKNYAVNLNMCLQVRRERYKWYPDNKGLPSIEFAFSGNTELAQWVFETEDARDAEYVMVMNAPRQRSR